MKNTFVLPALALLTLGFSLPALAVVKFSSTTVLEKGDYKINCKFQKEDPNTPLAQRTGDPMVKIDGSFSIGKVDDNSRGRSLDAKANAEAKLDLKIKDPNTERILLDEKDEKFQGKYRVDVGILDDDGDDNVVKLEGKFMNMSIQFNKRSSRQPEVDVWVIYKQNEINIKNCEVKKD